MAVKFVIQKKKSIDLQVPFSKISRKTDPKSRRSQTIFDQKMFGIENRLRNRKSIENFKKKQRQLNSKASYTTMRNSKVYEKMLCQKQLQHESEQSPLGTSAWFHAVNVMKVKLNVSFWQLASSDYTTRSRCSTTYEAVCLSLLSITASLRLSLNYEFRILHQILSSESTKKTTER